VLLLVDASEGPLPQTRFVLRKTLEARLPVILVINKVDRPDARIAPVVHDVEELFLDLDADVDQLDFPIVYCVSRQGRASLDRPADGAGLADGATLKPLLDLLVERIPAPTYDPALPLQALVTNLDASPYVGRLALCRVRSGTLRKGSAVAWCRADGTIERARIAELYTTDALDRVPAEEAGPGEIAAVAGIPEITIGETLADLDDPRPLPVIHIDDPSLSMTIGINTSPFAGQDGTSLTARLVKSRLDAELVGNVSIRVLPTERPDTWEVQGRGELQLAVLVEMMRREGFELTVGKPRVLTREIDGVVHEPVDRLTVDVPEEFLGVITQLLALRKGRLEQIVNHGTGWVRLDYLVPARGLIGFRTELLTETRGTALLHHVFERFEPWAGAIRARTRGSLVADRRGPTTGYSLLALQERGQLFVGPGTEVYAGMVVGENARADDMDVNPTKEKKLTNIRSSTAESFEKLIPPRPMSLEQALEFIADDECVEVTPRSIRVRKAVLDQATRARAAKRAKTQS
jgi:GTP-binding protein